MPAHTLHAPPLSAQGEGPSRTTLPHAALGWPFDASGRPYDRRTSGRRVLLAFDASPESSAAARVTRAIAHRLGATVEVVSVVDTTTVPIPFTLDMAPVMGWERANGPVHQERERELLEQLSDVLETPVSWPIAVELGRPADAITRHSQKANAALVVVGLRHHGRIDRMAHEDTALAVMRGASSPVLGVPIGASGLPTSVLVAMDFSPASVHAATMAATLVAPGGRLTLAFVESTMEPMPGTAEGVLHHLGLDDAFARLERALGTDALRVDHVVLHRATPGMPSATLLEHADTHGIDLIAAGSARHGRLDRILLGSVSAELLRDGRFAVLVVPPARE